MSYSTEAIRENAIKCYLQGFTINEICETHHVVRSTIYRWIEKYNNSNSVKRKSNPGSGRPIKIDRSERDKLSKIILKPASKYGYETDFWTSRRIIQIAKKKLNISISKSTMCSILYDEGNSYKKPVKRY